MSEFYNFETPIPQENRQEETHETDPMDLLNELEKDKESFSSMTAGSSATIVSSANIKALARQNKQMLHQKQVEIDRRSVYVSNVEYEVPAEQLHELFSQCGKVVRVTIKRNARTGKPMGFAYVEFEDADSARQALLLNGKELADRELSVAPKRTNIKGYYLQKIKHGRGARSRGRSRFANNVFYGEQNKNAK